jgi:hypothetical protein
VVTRNTGSTATTIYVNEAADGLISDTTGDMGSTTNLRIGGDGSVSSGAYFPVSFVSPDEKELGQERRILSGDTGNESSFMVVIVCRGG